MNGEQRIDVRIKIIGAVIVGIIIVIIIFSRISNDDDRELNAPTPSPPSTTQNQEPDPSQGQEAGGEYDPLASPPPPQTYTGTGEDGELLYSETPEGRTGWTYTIWQFGSNFTNHDTSYPGWFGRLRPFLEPSLAQQLEHVDPIEAPHGTMERFEIVMTGDVEMTLNVVYDTGFKVRTLVRYNGTDWNVISYE